MTEDNLTSVEQKETTNDDRKWCVYVHTSPSGKKYIGITSTDPEYRWGKNGYRYLQKDKNNQYKQPAMAFALIKYPNWDEWKHEIVADNQTEYDAKEIEKDLIKYFKSNNKEFGYNLTDGGDTMWNGCHSDEYRKLLSERTKERFKKPENTPWFGKHLPEYMREKISQSHIGGNNPTARKTIRLCDFKVYGCMKDAAKENNMSIDTMRKKCRQHDCFMYYDEWLVQQN